MKKMTTQNGNVLLFSDINGHAVYVDPAGGHTGDYSSQYSRFPEVLKNIRNGKQEWDWAMENWGVEPQDLSDIEVAVLEHCSPHRNLKTVSVKNSKGESWIFQQSPFLKTADGHLVCRGYGRTRRRNHQGGNGWELYNIEILQGEFPVSKPPSPLAVFGTHGVCETNAAAIHEGDLVAISQPEWEDLAGRKFFPEVEFHWFRGSGVRGVEVGKSTGIHKEGEYVFRHSFPKDAETGRYGVYRDGEYEPLVTTAVESPIGRIYAANDEGRNIFFYRFKRFNLPAVWVGYEFFGEAVLPEICGQLKLKVAVSLQKALNEKLKRADGDKNLRDAIEYFTPLGGVKCTPRDSKSRGNCAVGTWEFLQRNFSNLPTTNEWVSWDNFPVSENQGFFVTIKMIQQNLSNSNFCSLVLYKYKRANPAEGELQVEEVVDVLFTNDSAGLLSEKDLYRLGVDTEMERAERLRSAIERNNKKNDPPVNILGEFFKKNGIRF